MTHEIRKNEADANVRDVPIQLEAPSGAYYTGSTAGFTITYRKPGSGSETTKTLTSDTDGRYRMTLTLAETDTTGIGWISIRDASGDIVIIPYRDPVLIRDTDPAIATATALAAVSAKLPASLVSGRIDASVGAYQSGLVPLQPTVASRTLDVTATGEAGIDWNNIGAPTTTQNLSGTTIGTLTTLASGALTAVANAVMSYVIEAAVGMLPARTMLGYMRGMFAAVAGLNSGNTGNAPVFRNANDTKDVITGTTTSDGRPTVTYDLT